MALQQCLACNNMVPESCKTCACGHVFEGMKQIGGKRFSGYRAQLYTRLESKRMKLLTGRKRGSRVLVSSDEEINLSVLSLWDYTTTPKFEFPSTEKVLVFDTKKEVSRPAAFIGNFRDKMEVASEYKPKQHYRSSSPPSKLNSHNRQEQNPVPAEMIDRLPKALAEINRRLLGQNLLWAGL